MNIDNKKDFALGSCGDAWKLHYCGDDMDVIDHRPFANKSKTPVGLCCDANILILYPERGQIDWDNLIDESLKDGRLCSGASIKVIYLTNEDHEYLSRKRKITIQQIKKLAKNSQDAFTKLKEDYIKNEKRAF